MDIGVIIPIVGSLFGVIVGSGISIYTTYSANKASSNILLTKLHYDIVSLKIQKLEELYVLIDKWGIAAASFYLPFIKVIKKEISYDNYLDIVSQTDHTNIDMDVSKIRMLVSIYSIEFIDKYEEIMSARSDIVSFQDEIIRNNNINISDRTVLEEYNKKQVELEKKYQNLRISYLIM